MCRECDRKEAKIYNLRMRLFRANQIREVLQNQTDALLGVEEFRIKMEEERLKDLERIVGLIPIEEA